MKNKSLRKILTIKDPKNLSTSDYFLYHPYKNIVENLYKLSINKNEGKFDFIYKEFNGINNADNQKYYESFLSVTSYFQASKGGRGKYIEKKLSAVDENCCLDNKISDLPKLLLFKDIMRKSKLFGKQSLSQKEKEKLRLCAWDFIANNDETSDLCYIKNNTLSFLELKNRIDSGGTAARREIFDNKFTQILSYFLEEKKVFKHEKTKYKLLDFYKHFKINKIRISLGILFDTEGEYATKESDSRFGFYSSSRECFNRLSASLKKNKNVVIEKLDNKKLFLSLKLNKNFTIEISSVYGNEIATYLYQREVNLNNLIKNKYDDIWLFQLLAIDERANLLRYNDNIILNLKKHINSNSQFKGVINNFINNSNLEELEKFLKLLPINKKLIPNNREKDKYLMDIMYFIIANDDDI